MSEKQPRNLDIEQIEENVADELEKLPNDRARHVVERYSVSKSGPLPDPEDFKKYEEALPGAADRILKIAELEQSHRHSINDKDMTTYHKNTYKLTKFGMTTGLISGSIGSTAGVLIAIFGNTTSGTIILLASILPLIVSALKDLFKRESAPPSENIDD